MTDIIVFPFQLKKQTQTHKDEVINLQQTAQKLRQELTECKTGCEKKAEELAKINQEYNAQEAALTDIRNKELQVILLSLPLMYIQSVQCCRTLK